MEMIRFLSCIGSATALSVTSVFASVCDYKPTRLAGSAASAVSATVGGSAAAAGVGLKAAGYYTLVHSTSGLTMLGSTAAGASAAGTTGIIAGSTGAGAVIATILMAPATIAVGAVTVIAVGSYEGACYFQIEREKEPFRVRAIIESIAANDPAVSIAETDGGPVMVLAAEDRYERYLVRDLYIADGELLHRDWLWNTNLGPVTYVEPLPEAE